MLGPGDLRLSLGLPPKKFGQQDDSQFLAAVDHLIQASRKHRKPLMTVSFKVNAEKDTWIRSFSMLLTSADIVSVQKGHQAGLQAMRQAMGRPINGHANGHTNRHANGYTNGKSEKAVEKNGVHA